MEVRRKISLESLEYRQANFSKEIDLNSSTDRKRTRDPKFSDIEESKVRWFK